MSNLTNWDKYTALKDKETALSTALQSVRSEIMGLMGTITVPTTINQHIQSQQPKWRLRV
jgi:hypothetical protein